MKDIKLDSDQIAEACVDFVKKHHDIGDDTGKTAIKVAFSRNSRNNDIRAVVSLLSTREVKEEVDKADGEVDLLSPARDGSDRPDKLNLTELLGKSSKRCLSAEELAKTVPFDAPKDILESLECLRLLERADSDDGADLSIKERIQIIDNIRMIRKSDDTPDFMKGVGDDILSTQLKALAKQITDGESLDGVSDSDKEITDDMTDDIGTLTDGMLILRDNDINDVIADWFLAKHPDYPNNNLCVRVKAIGHNDDEAEINKLSAEIEFS